MSDLHPENLLERVRYETLSADEEVILQTHLQKCEACALVYAARKDFSETSLEDRSDPALLERMVEQALETQRRRIAPTAWAAAAATLLAVMSGATAAWYYWDVQSPSDVPDGGASERSVTVPFPPVTVEPAGDGVDVEDAPRQEAASPEAIEPDTSAKREVLRKPHRIRRTPRSAEVPVEPTHDASELFRMANAARNARAYGDARKAYERLISEFPTSREANVARVSLGRLLLDQLGDPAAGLRHFDRYLQLAGDSASLSAEALAGRAHCLQRLGRKQAEFAAWQRLIAKHPQSHHAEAARARLEQLKP